MDHRLLKKFFQGECSEEEHLQVMKWYLSGKADHELSKKIEAYWNDTKKNEEWEKDEIFKSIHNQINKTSDKEKVIDFLNKSKPGFLSRNFHYAAVISLLLASAAFYYYTFLHSSNVTAQQATNQSNDQDNIIVKKTARGEKLTITLEDSTVIKLNSESQLKYKPGNSREVFLVGEAFFDVVKDTLHPFLIHSGNVTTTVLGTSFNIKAFEDDDVATVSVVTGKVKVEKLDSTHKQAIHLIPGEQAVYTYNDTIFTKKEFDYQDVLSWKEGRLYFKNARFSDVISTLERWYGVEIEVRGKKIEDGFSGSYSNRSLESVLEGMSFVLNFEYEIHNNQIIIK